MPGRHYRGKTLLKIIAASFAVVVLTVIAAGCGGEMKKPQPAPVAAGSKQTEAAGDREAGQQRRVPPDRDPFIPLAQAPVEDNAAPGNPDAGMVAAPSYPVDEVLEKRGAGLRDPFEPLIVAYDPETTVGLSGRPSGGGDSGAVRPQERATLAGDPELVATYVENGEEHAYFGHGGGFYDAREGESFNGYRVLRIEPAGNRATLEKDGRVITLTAKGSLK